MVTKLTNFELVRSVLGYVGVNYDTMRQEDWLSFVLLQIPPGELITAVVDDEFAQCVSKKSETTPIA